jgi:hypothetical protein
MVGGMLDLAGSETTFRRGQGALRAPGALAWSGSGAALALLLTAAALAGTGLRPSGIVLGLQWTARLAFVAFWPCYAAGSLVVLFGRWLAFVKRRSRVLGLTFAAVMAVHFGLVAALCAIGAAPPVQVFLIFGPGALCVLLMAVASIGAVGRAIGPAGWWWLRNVAMNYLLIDFWIDFAHREPLTTHLGLVQYLPFAVLTATAAVLRLAAWLKTRA